MKPINRIRNKIKRTVFSLAEKTVPLKKNKIILLTESNSGSNTRALYDLVPDKIKQKYNISLVKPVGTESFFKHLKYVGNIGSSAAVVCTHGFKKKKQKQKHIELWHGFPLKSMNLMDPFDVGKGRAKPAWPGIDMVASYSSTYSTLMNACMGLDISKYKITGLPRNDLLFSKDGVNKLNIVMGSETGGRRIVFYMPTFRQGFRDRIDGAGTFDNIFRFDRFEKEKFKQFLNSNNLRFIAKLHPFEEKVFLNSADILKGSGIELLTGKALKENDIDLYTLLSACNILITDYSSVYIDLLLKDIPLIFTPVDLEDYLVKRGMLMEPYDFWTPGPKAVDQNRLEEALNRFVNDSEYYRKERNILNKIMHTFNDNDSSLRVWNNIIEILE